MKQIDRLHLDYPFAGGRMLRDMLNRQGRAIGRKHVATLMRKMGVEALYRKPNTSRKHPQHAVYPYLLRKLEIERANHVWAMDITYIPMARGWVYLAAVVDWASRRVLAHRVSISMDASFCIEALEEAFAKYGKPEILNTDQGSQFTNAEFVRVLKELHRVLQHAATALVARQEDPRRVLLRDAAGDSTGSLSDRVPLIEPRLRVQTNGATSV